MWCAIRKATSAASASELPAPTRVVLEVEDRGVGLGKEKGSGMGLVSMRERAELVNGRVEFLDVEGGGTLVRMTVPAA